MLTSSPENAIGLLYSLMYVGTFNIPISLCISFFNFFYLLFILSPSCCGQCLRFKCFQPVWPGSKQHLRSHPGSGNPLTLSKKKKKKFKFLCWFLRETPDRATQPQFFENMAHIVSLH